MVLFLVVSLSFAIDETGDSVFAILEEEAALSMVSSGRREQAREELPTAVTVITAEDIRSSGLVFLPEILRRYAGVTVNQRTELDWTVSLRSDFSLGTNDKVLRLIDGRPAGGDAMGTASWRSALMSLDNIERIEITRGPSTVLYGAGAFSGIINVVTKKHATTRAMELRTAGGMLANPNSSGFVHARAGHAAAYKRFDYRVDFETTFVGRRSPQSDDADLVNLNFAAEAGVAPTPASRLSLGMNVSGTAPSSFIATPGDRARSLEVGTDQMFDLRYTLQQPFGSRGTLEARISYRALAAQRRLSNNPDTYSFVAAPGKPPSQSSRSIAAELHDVQHLGSSHVLSTGIEARLNLVEWLDIVDTRRGGVSIIPALYIQDEWQLSRRFRLVGGVRGEVVVWPGGGAGPFVLITPRLASIFELDRAHSLRINVARGMRSPSALDLYGIGHPPNYLAGNPATRVEDTWSLDVSHLFRSGSTMTQATVFGMLAEGLRRTDDAPILGITSGDSVRGIGAELEVSFKVDRSLSVALNGAVRRMFAANGGRYRAGPEHQANLTLNWTPDERFAANLALGYVGEQYYRWAATESFPVRTDLTVPARFYADARLSVELGAGFSLGVLLSNIQRFFAPTVEYVGAAAQLLGGRAMLELRLDFGELGSRYREER